jgi:cation/acetate symporter
MVSLAFAIAASANFPVLFMSVLWKDCTTRGAVIGGFLGLASSVLLTVVSPSVWEATLGNPKGSALFPYTSPALFSMTIGFVGIWLFSILDRSERARQDRAGFIAQQVRSETGIGAASCERALIVPRPAPLSAGTVRDAEAHCRSISPPPLQCLL